VQWNYRWTSLAFQSTRFFSQPVSNSFFSFTVGEAVGKDSIAAAVRARVAADIAAKAVGWPSFLSVVGLFCAAEDIGDLTPRRTRSARLLQAARVYAAFHALPRDANGRVAAMQLHVGVGPLRDGIVSGGLNETVGLLGISHLGDLSGHSRMTWTEFVAFLHAAHLEQGNEARIKEGMDALLTEEERRLKKHHQRMAAQGLADGLEGEEDDLSDDGVSIARDDIFLQRYGYSWDYALVFRTTTERDMLARSDFQQAHSEGKVARRLAGAGLEVMMYKSSDQDEIFLLVRASLERLMLEADRIDIETAPGQGAAARGLQCIL
jgi:hypothetical protein